MKKLAFNMKKSIDDYFKEKNIPGPQSDGDYINSTYHSLAYSYKVALKELEEIIKFKFNEIYIVGGGAKNDYLNELTRHYTKLNVKSFPIEATVIGNLKVQMKE